MTVLPLLNYKSIPNSSAVILERSEESPARNPLPISITYTVVPDSDPVPMVG